MPFSGGSVRAISCVIRKVQTAGDIQHPFFLQTVLALLLASLEIPPCNTRHVGEIRIFMMIA
jgi:hypothetical protein